MKATRIGIHSAAAALFLLASFPALSATSNFNSTTEVWSVQGDFAVPVTWNSTGGDPGGYVSVVDSVVGGVMYFVAPAAYLGNQSGAYGTALTFDLMQNYSPDGPNQFADDNGDVLLHSSALTLAYRLPTNPANEAWTSYSVLLAAGSWYVGDLTGPAATAAQMQSVLSGLTGLQIRAEYQDGPDTDGLDSVNLAAATPLPAALPLFATGLGALGLAGWRRKRKAAAIAAA